MLSENTRDRRLARAAIALVFTVYAVAFFVPVTDANTPRVMYGYQAFYWTLITLIYLPKWLVNPAAPASRVRIWVCLQCDIARMRLRQPHSWVSVFAAQR